MEQLLQQMSFTGLEEVPALSKLRYVPKGFALQADLRGDEYAAGIATLRARVDHGKRSRYGFSPKQVLKTAIHPAKGSLYEQNTLSNKVHPIFAHNRFVHCPVDIYNVLTPALRLATLFLTDPTSSTYFLTLAFGEREVCEATLAIIGCEVHRIRDDVPWSAELATEFDKQVLEMVKYVDIGFDFLDPLSRIYGTMFACDIRRRLPLDDRQRLFSRINLHTDFYTTAKRLVLLGTNAEPAMVMRFYFFFAVNIVHEVAHFLELSTTAPAHEAFMNDNTWNEAGAAWEMKMFGGRVHPINCRLDCAHGLTTYQWPLRAVDDPEGPTVFYAIPMEYIARLQQQDTLEQDWIDVDWQTCHIPKTDAKSIGVLGFNMTIYEDEHASQDVDALAGMERRFDFLHRTSKSRIISSYRRKNKKHDSGGRTITGLRRHQSTLKKTAFKRSSGPKSKTAKLARKRDTKWAAKVRQIKWLRRIELSRNKMNIVLSQPDKYGRKRSV
ncbi:hypothetical protein BDV97DRAFT_394289 [Delphinella strobiligena]|nr:hypothetical protein BDV97DRAFT_394289 [Delphinella strobiligena]